MDENLSRGYIQLGKSRMPGDVRLSNGFNHLSPPIDKYNGIYLSLVMAGVGFLMPYNSFIIAVDYFTQQYPGTTIIFDMSLVYIVMAFFAVLANNILVETLSLNTRITFGYLVSFVTLLFVATCEVWLGIFGHTLAYTVNLIAVAVVALGCTVQQSSFYGYTSMLPSRYTQAVMAGESGAGFLISINRIMTKLMLENPNLNTLMFFGSSASFVAGCFFLHQIVRKTDFVQFYLTLCRESKKITLEPAEDLGLMDPSDQIDSSDRNQYGVLKLNQQSPIESSNTGFSFANPVYEPNSATTGTTYKVEDVVIRLRSESSGGYTSMGPAKVWTNIKRGLIARWEVAKSIWHYMLSIGLAYFVTLCLYPGIESEIISCKWGSWMPVILMTVFNASDLIGKILASVPYEWSRSQLLMFASARAVLVPLLLLCATPRGNPFIPEEAYPLFFTMLLGLSNGLVGSVPMIQAPSRIADEHRELTGNIMTLSYNIGLTGGSLVAYLLDAMLGPPVSSPCTTPSFVMYHNRSIFPSERATRVTTQTVVATVATTVATAATTAMTVLSTTQARPYTTLKPITMKPFIFNSTSPIPTLVTNATSLFTSTSVTSH